jgi:hypothetical protein
VAHLGELDERGRIEARALAQHLIGATSGRRLLRHGTKINMNYHRVYSRAVG